MSSIVSKISNIICNAVRTLCAVTRRSPWLAPAALLVLFFVV